MKRSNLGARAGASKRTLGLSLAALFVSTASAAFAQTTPGPAAPDEGAGPAIVVTATRQATNIQKTPVQVIALSGQKLKDAAVNQFNDITYLAPSVRFTSNSGSGQTAIAMRGIGTSPSAAYTVAGVQVYEEEVPLAGAALNLSPYDLSDIQVLEGPQGTLFGRNTLAGAILIEPKLPSFSQDGYIKAGYGSFNYWTLEGGGNATIIPDVLAVRVAGQIQRRDGDIQSLSPNLGTQGNLATEGFRASVLFTPTATFKDVLTVDYFHENDTGSPALIADPLNYLPLGPLPFGFGPVYSPAQAAALAACHHTCLNWGSMTQSDSNFQNEHAGVFNTTTWNITPNLSLKNIVAFQDTTDHVIEATLPAPFPLFNAENYQPQSRFTEEVQLTGHAVDNRLEVRGGFYYESDWSHGLDAHDAVPEISFLSYQSASQSEQSHAFYVDGNFKATSRLTFRGGFRYTWDNQQNCSGTGFNTTPPTTPPAPPAPNPFGTAPGTSEYCKAQAAFGLGNPGNTINAVTAHIADEAPTWSYGVDFQATDNIFLYFTGSRGYREPTFNPTFNSPCNTGGVSDHAQGTTGAANQVGCANDLGIALGGPATGHAIDLRSIQNLAPETIDNFEGGFKSQWRAGDWRFVFNMDVFHYTWKNAQDQINLDTPGTASLFGTGATACAVCESETSFGGVTFAGGTLKATGFEGELGVQPNRDLSFDAHFSYLNQGVSLSTPAVFGAAGLTGPELLNAQHTGAGQFIQQLSTPTAPWSFTIAAHYTLPWHPLRGDLVVNYDYFWTASWFAQNLPVPGYDLHNLRVDWDHIAGSNIDVGVWVRNLFDKDYELAVIDAPVGVADWGEQRMIGFDVTAKFH